MGTGEISLFRIHGYDLEIGTNNEEIEFSASGLSLSAFENDSSFEYGRGR